MTVPARPSGVPRATIRLQFHAGFTLDDAERHVPYFAALGASHIYASPLLAARPGSTHGYDIVDHNAINPELGGRAAFDRFVTTLHRHGLGLIVDIVPNHMGVGGADNGWWLDVLEWGRNSAFARFFDIDWDPPEGSLKGKLLVPLLGAHYGEALRSGDFALRFDRDGGTFSVWYHEHRLPIAPRDYAGLLGRVADGDPATGEALAPLTARFSALGGGARTLDRQTRIAREADGCKAALAACAREQGHVMRAIDGMTDALSGRKDDPDSFGELHRLMERQSWRLAYWRVATDEVNYRRFFDINSLAGLRMEDPELFELSHRLIFSLIAEGRIDGLRLDHIDGLTDPVGYCRRLQERAAYLRAGRATADGVEAPPETMLDTPLYVVVEKILAPHERLRRGWPVNGTTGYEFMAQAGGLFVAPDSEARLKSFYAAYSGNERDYERTAEEARRQIVRTNLASELSVLAGALHRLAKTSLYTRDFTLNSLRLALIDIVGHFPVYRTYVGDGGADEEDRRYVDWAVTRARRSPGSIDGSVFDFIHAVLSADVKRLPGTGWRRPDILGIARKFQQFTGPVAAKAEEDTAFYRYMPLVSLNEVGGSPARFGTAPATFHHACLDRMRHYPHSMLATATHDHKLGEDVRARIAVLSEISGTWTRRVRRWTQLNRHKRSGPADRPAPSRNDEYLLYQVLVGAWPLGLAATDEQGLAAFAGRIADFAIKAARQAKTETGWDAPDAAYESGVRSFVEALLDSRRSYGFLADLAGFADGIKLAGAVNGLAQTALKLTAPGVPDIYQAATAWDLSLVDPDNRRPVPFEDLTAALESAAGSRLSALLPGWEDGRIKQATIARILGFRATHAMLFAAGDYAPVEAVGKHAARLVAFVRSHGSRLVLTVVPRLVAPLLGDAAVPLVPAERWEDTVLSVPDRSRRFVDILTGKHVAADDAGRLAAGAVLEEFPVAVLEAVDA